MADWKKNKSKVAYYAFGDSSRQTDVENIVIEDAIVLLETELEKLRKGLSSGVNKADPSLNQAIVYFACHQIIKAGQTSQRSGKVVSETMDGMSVSYEATGNKQINEKNQPKDFWGSAIDMINRWAESNLSSRTKLPYGISNSRSKLFDGIYDKYREDNRYGVP